MYNSAVSVEMMFAVDVETFNGLYNNEYCRFCRTSGKHRVEVELSSGEIVSNSPSRAL